MNCGLFCRTLRFWWSVFSVTRYLDSFCKLYVGYDSEHYGVFQFQETFNVAVHLLITSAVEVMFFAGFCLSVCLFVCLSVCQQDNSKSYRRIFLKFLGYVGHGINYQWFNFGRDPAGILDSGLLWNFRYHCVKGGIREPLAKRRWWRHLVNSFALVEVPAGYDCFLVFFNLALHTRGHSLL